MITNLVRPWVLARLLSGSAAVIVCAIGMVVAYQVLRRWRADTSGEGQLALERRAELVATLVQVALAIAIVDAALTVLVADRSSASIRGAMCAWGVFDANTYGFVALATSLAAAAGCALWVLLHRLDLKLARAALTTRKFGALFVLGPLLAFDSYAFTRWMLDLDMRVLASCCSVGLDAALATTDGATGGPRDLAVIAALGGSIAAALACAWTWHRPSTAAAILAATFSVAATVAAVPAILWFVAPHAYETPNHLCPFCLLHGNVGGIGWPLFGALFGAALLGCGIGLVQSQARRSGQPAEIRAMQRRLAKWASFAWVATVLIALAPIARYAWITGGASLFGD